MLKNPTAFVSTIFITGLFLNLAIYNALAGRVEASTTLPGFPSGLKTTFMLGLANQPGHTGWMNGSGAKWDARYQYLCGGANTGTGWANWNSPAGMFASYYLDDSFANGYLPVLTYYQMLQSNPAVGANEGEKDFNNLNNPSTMYTYYADFKLLMDRAKIFGKAVVVHVEPDLWGFLQHLSNNPNSLSASVSGSGFADTAGLPNTVSGFARALVNLRNKYAPNVLLAYHISSWGSTFGDIATSHDAAFDVNGAALQTANFYNSLSANYDLLFYDIADRDAAFYASYGDSNHWWDTTNTSFPNFNRFSAFAAAITAGTGKRGMLWQVPIGNTIYQSMNNSHLHWQDNRVQYYLNYPNYSHLQDLINSGILGILFGAGDSNTTTYEDTAGDGVTNPAPINGNTRPASVSDDDGGNLRFSGQAYYAHGALSLGGGLVPTPTPTTVPATATPTTAIRTTTVPASTAPPTTSPPVVASPTPTIPRGVRGTVTPGRNWQLTALTTGSFEANANLTISARFTPPAGVGGDYLIDVEVFSSTSGTKTAQWYTTRTFIPGQSFTFDNNFSAPAGNYVVKLGLFTSNWSPILWNDAAGTLKVAASAPAGVTWQMTSALNAPPLASSVFELTTHFNPASGAAGPFQLDIEVYNLATGVRVAQWVPFRSFSSGQPISLTNSLSLPSGEYQVRLGVFNSRWSLLSWQANSLTFTVK